MLLAALSGLLLTGAFPKIGLDWLAWFALYHCSSQSQIVLLKKAFGSVLSWVWPII